MIRNNTLQHEKNLNEIKRQKYKRIIQEQHDHIDKLLGQVNLYKGMIPLHSKAGPERLDHLRINNPTSTEVNTTSQSVATDSYSNNDDEKDISHPQQQQQQQQPSVRRRNRHQQQPSSSSQQQLLVLPPIYSTGHSEMTLNSSGKEINKEQEEVEVEMDNKDFSNQGLTPPSSFPYQKMPELDKEQAYIQAFHSFPFKNFS